MLCGRFVPRVVSDPCLPLRQRACPGEAGSIVCASCSLLDSADRIILLITRLATPHHRTPHRRASPSAAPSAWPLGLALAHRPCRTRSRRMTVPIPVPEKTQNYSQSLKKLETTHSYPGKILILAHFACGKFFETLSPAFRRRRGSDRGEIEFAT